MFWLAKRIMQRGDIRFTCSPSWRSVMPERVMIAFKTAQEVTPQAKLDVTSKSPVGYLAVVTMKR